MRIALTGVSGFIGSNIAKRLVDAGHEVSGLVRETSNWQAIQPYCCRLTYGDHADETVYHDLLEGCDCVVHNSVDREVFALDPFAGRGAETGTTATERMVILPERPFQVLAEMNPPGFASVRKFVVNDARRVLSY